MSSRRVTRVQVVEKLGVTKSFLALLEREAIVCADAEQRYGTTDLESIRVCWTLHHDLGVNAAGLEVALTLLDRLHEERRRTRAFVERLRRG